MAGYVVMGAILQCSFGVATTSLIIVDPMRPMFANKFIATMMDNKPITNVATFGMCQCQANPAVIAATAAAMGTPTPAPCVPVLAAPWSPTGSVMVKNYPVLTSSSKLMCTYGGQISITNTGQTNVKE